MDKWGYTFMSWKHCGKRRNCSLWAFLLFPLCFQKLCVVDASKWVPVELRVNSLPHSLNLERPWERNLLKTLWEKEKIMVISIFSFSHDVFNPIMDRNYYFSNIKFVICKCFHLAKSKMLSFVKRLTERKRTEKSEFWNIRYSMP